MRLSSIFYFIVVSQKKEVRVMGKREIFKVSKQIARELGVGKTGFRTFLRCNLSFMNNEKEIRDLMLYVKESDIHRQQMMSLISN
jgi:hypothetical protein